MEIDRKLLHAALGKPSRDLKFLQGSEKRLVELIMLRGASKMTLDFIVEKSFSLVESLNFIDCQRTMAGVLGTCKYVYYDGNIFMDCFAPKWPGRALNNSLEAVNRSLTAVSDEWGPFLQSLVFSITKKCVYRCEHCYAIHTLGEQDVMSAEDMLRIAKEFQGKIGVGVMAWEGGEPLMRFDDLLMLIRGTSPESESLVATTAYGLDGEKARRLKEAGLVSAIISLDHYEPDRHNAFRRNKKAFDMAVNGVRIFRENGILPSIAICATRDVMEEGSLYEYLELAKNIGAAFVQILDATPSGNYIGKDVLLTKAQMEELKRFQVELNTSPRYRDYPSVQARAFMEDEKVNGCNGGNALAYVDSSGNLQACDLLQLSFGNVMEEDVETVFRRLKKHFPHPKKGRCPAQTLSKDIARGFEKTAKLPLQYCDCADILEKIDKMELPDRFMEVKKKKERRKPGDFMR